MTFAQLGLAAAELVAGGKHLRKLSLFGARLGDEGARRVAAIMGAEALTGLLELELAGCSIGDRGMQALFDALQTGVAPALEVRSCQPADPQTLAAGIANLFVSKRVPTALSVVLYLSEPAALVCIL